MLLHHVHDRLGFRTRRLEVQALVVDREAPLDLLAMRRPVVVERVGQRRERLLEPALVQHRPVGVGALDDEEGVAELVAEIVVLAETASEELERQRADRLVRVRRAEQQGAFFGPLPIVSISIGRPSVEVPIVCSVTSLG